MNRARSALPLVLVAIVAGCSAPAESPSGDGDDASPTPVPTVSAEGSASPSASATQQAAGEEEVLIADAQFEPSELTVAVGIEIAFVNEDGYGHTVTEGTDGQPADDAFVDEEVAAGETVRVVFDEPGTFDITCIIHPTMQMTITVED